MHDAFPFFDYRAGWLHDLLQFAVESGACIKWTCTTCGGLPFRDALQTGASNGAALNGRSPLDEAIDQLRHLRIDPQRSYAFGEARRLVLLLVASGALGEISTNDLIQRLEGTEAREALLSILAHAQRVEEDRRAREAAQSPAAVALRRQAKRRERAERHAARLEQKVRREATPEWHSRFGHRKGRSPDNRQEQGEGHPTD